MKKTKILKTLSIVIILTVVIIGISSNKKGVVFAQDSSKATKVEKKVNKKVNKIMKKIVSKKDSYNIKYTEKDKEGNLNIDMKLDKYSEEKAYELAKKSIEKIDKKYSSKIDTYKFHISSKNKKNAIQFDIKRSKLKKVKLKKIGTKQFMELAQNTWIYNNTLKYKVESIDDISIGNAKREVMNVVVEGKYKLDQLYNIAKKEALQYTKENKMNALVVGFYTDKSHIGKGYDMGSVLYAPNGKIEYATKIKSGDYSDFKFVNELEEAIVFQKGKELKETKGSTNIDTVKKDILKIESSSTVSVKKQGSKLIINIKETKDHPYVDAEENAIGSYTDWCLDNIKSDISTIDITVERPGSSVHAILDMKNISTDNGRYFDTNYIRENIE